MDIIELHREKQLTPLKGRAEQRPWFPFFARTYLFVVFTGGALDPNRGPRGPSRRVKAGDTV
jgi:hypothetical protein